MKDLGYVCLRCRVKLLAASTSTSTVSSSSRRQAAAFTQNLIPNSKSNNPNQSRTFASISRSLPIHGEKRRASRPIHYATKPREGASSASPEHASSVTLFKSIVQGSAVKHGQAPIEPSQEAHYKLMKDAAKLNEMIRKEMPRREKSMKAPFAFFEDVLYPQLVEAGPQLPATLKDALCRELIKLIFEERARHPESTDLPTVTYLTELTLELRVLKPAVWGTMMLELLQYISASSILPGDYATIEDYLNAMGSRDTLILDLMGAWEVFGRRHFAERETPQEADSAAAQDVPQKAEVEEEEASSPRVKKTKYSSSLQSIFHSMHSQDLGSSYSSMLRPSIAAVATYHLLQDPVNNKRAIMEVARPFLKMMSKLIPKANFPSLKAIEPSLEPYPELLQYLKWCYSKKGPKGRPLPRRPMSNSQTKPGLSDTIHRLVGQAIRGRNLTALKKAWIQFWGEDPVPGPDQIQELRKYPLTFDYFILAYMGMRRPELAINVWNRMESIGIQPTIKTWNAMIQGCTNAKNPHGIHTVWQKLVASGTKLDTAIWTARINGLITSGEPEAGLHALKEMAEIWDRRHEKALEPLAVKPTIEPVNGAVAGLLRFERGQAARNVLTWAAKQGIDPDIFTFNTLLRPLVRQGQMDKVDDIFRSINEYNVKPDAATFTIMLDGALANLGSEAPEKQVQIVTSIISRMKSTGIEVNMQMYAKMIYLFLQEGDRAGEPVKAVLSHIWASGLELTSHIYTMLAEHYFSRWPPNSAAVTALIASRRLHANRDIDRVFWERCIKGYCQVGETDRALEIFDKVFASGTTITFSTLYDFLLALVNSGDMGAARRLVVAARDIKEADELGRDAGRTRFWKHRFWHLVDQYGLMDERLVAPFLAAQSLV